MKSARLRGHPGREIHGVGCLRRSDSLATSRADAPAGVFAHASPQRTVGQGSLSQSRPNRERYCDILHVGSIALSGGHTADLAPSRQITQISAQCSGVPRRNEQRSRPRPARTRKFGGPPQTPVAWLPARNLSACLPWPQCAAPARLPASVCHPRKAPRTRRQDLPAGSSQFFS